MNKLYNIVVLFIFIFFIAFILLYLNSSINESFLVIEKGVEQNYQEECKKYGVDYNSVQCRNIGIVKSADEITSNTTYPGHIHATYNNKWQWRNVGNNYWN